MEDKMNIRKSINKAAMFFAAILLFTYCDHENEYFDDTPPTHPKNVVTYVGDNLVEISWDENKERDVAGYNVYFAYSYWGEYELIGNTRSNYFVDYDAVNGELYYYAVAAYDYDGNESELSYDKVYGVARPEGTNQSIFDYLKFQRFFLLQLLN